MHHPHFDAPPQTPLSQLRSALPERDALEHRSPPVSRTYRVIDSFKPAGLTRLHCIIPRMPRITVTLTCS